MLNSDNEIFSKTKTTKEKLLADLFDKFVEKAEINEASNIGRIFPSAVPLDSRLFLLCDGAKYRKLDPKYKKLYNVIGDTYQNDYNQEKYKSELLTDEEFCVPNMIERGMIMRDATGTLDDVREPGSNAEWSISESKLNDFDYESQNKVVLNNPNAPVNEEATTTQFTEPGNHVFVTKSYNQFNIVKNGAGDVRLGDKLRFDSKYVFYYIKYRDLEDIPNDEFTTSNGETIIPEEEMPTLP